MNDILTNFKKKQLLKEGNALFDLATYSKLKWKFDKQKGIYLLIITLHELDHGDYFKPTTQKIADIPRKAFFDILEEFKGPVKELLKLSWNREEFEIAEFEFHLDKKTMEKTSFSIEIRQDTEGIVQTLKAKRIPLDDNSQEIANLGDKILLEAKEFLKGARKARPEQIDMEEVVTQGAA